MIYLVEDDKSIRELLVYTLNNSGLPANGFEKPSEFYRELRADDADLIILDIMLPECDGLTMLKNLRADEKTKHIPVMMLTAKGSEYDKVVGLDMGADDYMTKPFSPREVLARMKAILRRTNKAVPAEPVATAQPEPTEDETEKIEVGEITIFPQLYEVHVAGELIEVTPKEFELLLYMAKRANRILSREQLLNAIWNFDYAGETRIVDVHISHLREKIEKDTKNPQYIRTVRGFGYKFEVAKT